jgi:elongation factor Ts
MTEISAALVKELRDETNVGMMECKRALAEANGDKVKALRILREKGAYLALKKSSRTAKQGLIASFVAADGKVASLVEVNCETDFVAKNALFQSFVEKMAEKAATLDGPLADTVKADITAKIAEIGENVVVRRNLRYLLQKTGIISSYVHHNGAIGVLVELHCGKDETTRQPSFKSLAKDVCIQVAASQPRFLDRKSVPADVVSAEREIFAKQVRGKPPQIIEKIVDGKMGKFYEQNCLVEQPFVKDEEKTVTALLKEKAVELADEIKIIRFVRLQVGEAV